MEWPWYIVVPLWLIALSSVANHGILAKAFKLFEEYKSYINTQIKDIIGRN